MASIDILRCHDLDHAHARAIVDAMAEEMQQKYATSHQWQADTLHFNRPGIDGQIRIEQGQIHVQARLGLLFSAMKPIIEREIEHTLNERFRA
ncbi:MAG: polyhydroxyalkanoic acid system family protein [Xanthomonadales bacterium]|nr:polyhydroxyalkanoic acid system family protein [Xanthomonadales bacterium]